jgi:serine phosphatase RsbU (regulator of sigma subunit)
MAGLAAYVARRRGAVAGASLSVVLAAAASWGVGYALELSAHDLATKGHWGDLKWIGICALPPAWLTFVLQYTGRTRLVTRRLLLVLLVEPVAVLAVLADPSTHDLVRSYAEGSTGDPLPLVVAGPVFWFHLVYANALLLVATGLFLASMVRLSRTYRRLAMLLVAAAMLPWVANLLYNFGVGRLAEVDLTPFAFTVTGGVLVWGLFRQRLLNLSPLARGVIVETMADAVFVLDAFGRLTDTNPSGTRLLRRPRPDLIGRTFEDLLTELGAGPAPGTGGRLTISEGGARRAFDVRRQPLTDRGGLPAGELVVLRDITDVVAAADDLQALLAERSRVAAALQASLMPADLPDIPSVEVASRFEPAGDGAEIGGDFLDVFSLGPSTWGVLLGDVSGKGAEAAAVTALTRYTLRTLADPRHSPARTLRELNTRLLAATTVERHCTLVYAIARPTPSGTELTMSLAGHHPPLIQRHDGRVEPFGLLGTALGLVDDPELHDSHAVLGPGDSICMFTDGLVEARHGRELFEAHRVAEVLRLSLGCPPEEVAGRLAAAARQFQGRNLTDDLAILVLRTAQVLEAAPHAAASAHPPVVA